MKKYDIKSKKIVFKNLFSGPAPVGRILNNVYLIGAKGLKHKSGNRNVSSKDGIGYAWTTEFMIGLGIAKLGRNDGRSIELELTGKGQELFNLMKNKYRPFDEGFHDSNILTVKAQINACHPDLYKKYKEVFFESYPFLILKDYLDEKGYCYNSLRNFYDDFFSWAANAYGEGSKGSNAGFNRMPSLIQLCKLFGIASTKKGLKFNEIIIKNNIVYPANKKYKKSELLKAAAEEQKMIDTSAKDLISMYGEDGNVLIYRIVRNSSLQSKFKHNLIIKQHGRCVICGIENKEMLIGSHIKSSAKSNVYEKIDHNNGLLLCCNHDRLFDRYLITFDANTGRIKISKSLTKDDIKRLGISKNFVLPNELLTNRRCKYLKIHNRKYEETEKALN